MSDNVSWTKTKRMKNIIVIPRTETKLPEQLDEGDKRLFNLNYGFGLEDIDDDAHFHEPTNEPVSLSEEIVLKTK